MLFGALPTLLLSLTHVPHVPALKLVAVTSVYEYHTQMHPFWRASLLSGQVGACTHSRACSRQRFLDARLQSIEGQCSMEPNSLFSQVKHLPSNGVPLVVPSSLTLMHSSLFQLGELCSVLTKELDQILYQPFGAREALPIDTFSN
jgi:hypothetical protein